jgi:hypothetical protein
MNVSSVISDIKGFELLGILLDSSLLSERLHLANTVLEKG